jgi:SAM-dependent methyltransferase
MTILSALWIFLAGLLVILAGLWVLLPMLYGSPAVPAYRRRIRRALELAEVRPGEKVYDLGAGDGRVIVIAAGEFGAQAVGIEIEPVHCAVAWLNAWLSGVGRHVAIRWGDFRRADLGEADVVFIYLTAAQTAALRPQLARQLRPGARLVSLSADIAGWQPAALDSQHLVFLYRMPPRPGSIETFLAG